MTSLTLQGTSHCSCLSTASCFQCNASFPEVPLAHTPPPANATQNSLVSSHFSLLVSVFCSPIEFPHFPMFLFPTHPRVSSLPVPAASPAAPAARRRCAAGPAADAPSGSAPTPVAPSPPGTTSNCARRRAVRNTRGPGTTRSETRRDQGRRGQKHAGSRDEWSETRGDQGRVVRNTRGPGVTRSETRGDQRRRGHKHEDQGRRCHKHEGTRDEQLKTRGDQGRAVRNTRGPGRSALQSRRSHGSENIRGSGTTASEKNIDTMMPIVFKQ